MKSKVGRNISIFLCVLLIAAIAALYVYIYAIPEITGSLTETAVLSYGRLSTSNEARCLVVRAEKLYTAGVSGTTSYYVKESEKTRKGVKILDIYGSPNAAFFCEETGFVSYYTDGYEDILTPETIEEIDPADYLAQSEEEEPRYQPEMADRTADSVEKGDPLFKLITSDSWYVAAFIPADHAKDYEWRQTVTVVFPDGTEIPGTVNSTVEKGDYLLAVIQIKRYYPDFAKLRLEDVTIITRDSEGLLVPNTALAEEDGQPGVYVKDINGEYNFKRVKVIVSGSTESLLVPDSFTETNEKDETVTVSTVGIYDEVLRNADEIK